MDFIIENYNLIATLTTAAIGLYLAVSTRKKSEADAIQSISNAASNLVNSQSKHLDDMETDMTNMEDYAVYLLEGIDKLTRQLKQRNIKPAFIPKPMSRYKKTLK